MKEHSLHSSLREKMLEHLFIGELLKTLWRKGLFDIEGSKPEVDNAGTDIIVTRGKVIRHIQLKSSFTSAKTARQNIHIGL